MVLLPSPCVVKELQDYIGSSKALTAAAIWTAIVQLIMTLVGTFVIKRFPTSFSVGFFLGLVMIVAQQNLLLTVTFWATSFGTSSVNKLFAVFAFFLFLVYGKITIAMSGATIFFTRNVPASND